LTHERQDSSGFIVMVIIKGAKMLLTYSKNMNEEKRFFIDGDNVRWVRSFIEKDIEWDYSTTHLVVSMKNNMNKPTSPSDVMVQSVNVKDMFDTLKNAQLEIIRRERFGK
jgi:hypothetical protein